jgi:hypothetical protein
MDLEALIESIIRFFVEIDDPDREEYKKEITELIVSYFCTED